MNPAATIRPVPTVAQNVLRPRSWDFASLQPLQNSKSPGWIGLLHSLQLAKGILRSLGCDIPLGIFEP